MIYTKDEVLKSTLEYFSGDELAANVWIDKYCLKDSEGKLYELNPNDMHKRLAKELARIEKKYSNPLSEEEIFDSIKKFEKIVPQGSPMSGIGNDFQISSISNCFVISAQKDKNGNYEDSYGSILRNDQEIIQLSKRRAGVGFTMEHIRPYGTNVKNAALTSTGLVSFMERFSNSIKEVAQSGRRGALLLSTHVKHPDAESFISAKIDLKKVTGANISIKIDDDFMNALEKNEKYIQQFPIYSNNPIIKKEIDTKTIWNKLIKANHASAEPGILFWSNIINESIADCYSSQGFDTQGVNPCGEITLCDSDSCRLLLLNLYSYVKNPFTKNAYFDFDEFSKYVQIAQRYMDDIVDLEIEKIDKILDKIEIDPETEETKAIEKQLWLRVKDKCVKGRRSGTGVTSEGDMLAALGYKYGTKEATEFSTEVHKTLSINAYLSSVNLAKERGSFPIFDFEKEKNNPFINRLYDINPKLKELTIKYGRRNIALLTLSPAGSVSILTQTTSGIEPLFLPYYKRRRKINPENKNNKIDYTDSLGDSWEEYLVFHHKFLKWAETNGYNIDEIKKMKEDELSKIVEKSPYHKACSNDVNWKESVIMQGSIQKFVDHSISKTINLPSDVTVELVDELYRTAWKSGCKGVTIYRDGSRSGVLVKSEEPKDEKMLEILKVNNAPKRPKALECDVLRFNNNNEKWIAFVGLMKDTQGKLRPYEIFTGLADEIAIPVNINKGEIVKMKEDGVSRYDFIYKDKTGKYKTIVEGLSRVFNREFHNYSRLLSSTMRHGMPIDKVIDLVDALNLDSDLISSWKKGVQRTLKKYVDDGKISDKKCEKCGEEALIYENGCMICKACGHGKC